MTFFWQTKEFKTLEQMNKWIDKNKHKYIIEQVFINDGFCVEYKSIKVIDIK